MSKGKRFWLTSPRVVLKERDVVGACLDLLRYRGYCPLRLHAGKARFPDGTWVNLHEIGTPDYALMHGLYPGFFLETKRPGGKTSPEQDTKIHELRLGYRLHVAIIDSADALILWLAQHEKEAVRRWHETGLSNQGS
jgi:hypothetical protein